MHTYKFKLYNSDKNKYIDESVSAAWEIYNHCIALHRRYYRLYGKHLSKNKLQKHIAKLRRRNELWQKLNSQAVQDITDRIERGYKAFFDHVKQHRSGKKSTPHFKKRKDYRSFTLKQCGYKISAGNVIYIHGRKYKYFKSRDIEGKIKTVTIKKMPSGDYYVFIVTDHVRTEKTTRTGKAVGIDFGLKTFLNLDDGTKISSPEFLKSSLKKYQRLSRNFSLKEDGSRNKEKAYIELMKYYEKLSNQRENFFFNLANELCQKYQFIAVEDLNLDGMKRLWGRKVSDLAYGEFLLILEYIASIHGVTVKKIDRFAPSSKVCSDCGGFVTLTLKDREWTCPHCGSVHDRDTNAAINIRKIAFGC